MTRQPSAVGSGAGRVLAQSQKLLDWLPLSSFLGPTWPGPGGCGRFCAPSPMVWGPILRIPRRPGHLLLVTGIGCSAALPLPCPPAAAPVLCLQTLLFALKLRVAS